MTVFWIVVALLLAGALLLLLPALLTHRAAAVPVSEKGVNVAVYRDQLREAERDLEADLISPERFEQARGEIQRRVLEDTGGEPATMAPARSGRSVWTAVVIAVAIPLASVLTYLALGEPDAAGPIAVPSAAAGGGDGRHSVTPDQIQKMVAALAERLKADPNNAEGWLMLARSYTALGRYRDSVTAFRRASELLPGNADVLADLADVMAMAQGKRLAGAPEKVIQQALDIDPRHVKSLALAGSVAFERKDYATARSFWERLLAVLPEGSDMARSVRGSIMEATQLENAGAAAAVAPGKAPPAAGGGAEVSGEVIISPELAAKVGAGDTLFVFARAAQGPRMPLAIVKRPAGELPYAFRLDDSMAMAPNLKLSGFPQVVVGARISRSGQATPQSGDLVGQSAAVAPGTKGLRIVIDSVQP